MKKYNGLCKHLLNIVSKIQGRIQTKTMGGYRSTIWGPENWEKLGNWGYAGGRGKVKDSHPPPPGYGPEIYISSDSI